MRIFWMFIANFFRLPRLLYGFLKLSNPKKDYTREEKYGWIHNNIKYANKGGRVVIDLTGLENLPKKSDVPLITTETTKGTDTNEDIAETTTTPVVLLATLCMQITRACLIFFHLFKK